jgi:hypothetical protein
MVGQMCAPVAVTGGPFSPSPPGNQALVNGWPNMSDPKPDNSNPHIENPPASKRNDHTTDGQLAAGPQQPDGPT